MKSVLKLIVGILFFGLNGIAVAQPVSVQSQTIKVFQYDGSIQCRQNTGVPLKSMAFALIKASIDVTCAQKASDGLLYAAVCGAKTGEINVYTVPATNLIDAEKLGFRSVSVLPDYKDTVCKPINNISIPTKFSTVFKPDGSTQCSKGSGISLKTMALELIKASIDVVSWKKTYIGGRVYVQMCGAKTGRINAYVIPSANLLDAKALGFQELVKSKPNNKGLVKSKSNNKELIAMLCSATKLTQAKHLLLQHKVFLVKQSSPTMLLLSWADSRSAKQVIQELQTSNAIFCGIEINYTYKASSYNNKQIRYSVPSQTLFSTF